MTCPTSQQLLITELKSKSRQDHLHCFAVRSFLYAWVYLSALSYEVLNSWTLGTRSSLSMSISITVVLSTTVANKQMSEGQRGSSKKERTNLHLRQVLTDICYLGDRHRMEGGEEESAAGPGNSKKMI